MSFAAIIATTLLFSHSFPLPQQQYFPGSYFDEKGHASLQRMVLASWPGPDAVLSRWYIPDLNLEQRATLLLGGSAYHDVRLLPVYGEAIVSPEARLRQAAAYGYRLLIADGLPDVTRGVNDQLAEAWLGEMRDMFATSRRHPLVAVWCQALLASEGRSLPGWSGLTLQRSGVTCTQAIDRLITVHDLDLLVTTYKLAEDKSNRISLLKLIQGLVFQRFIIKPKGERVVWGPEVYDAAERYFEDWLSKNCGLDGREILARRLGQFMGRPVAPFSAEACDVWLHLLRRGEPEMWALTVRQLYACGAPPAEIMLTRQQDPQNEKERDRVLEFYRQRK